MRPSHSRRRPSPARWAVLAAAVTAVATACSSAPPAAGPRATGTTGTTTSASSAPTTTAPTSATPSTSHTPAPTTTTPSTPSSCAPAIVAGMDDDERAGQLLMVGLDNGASRTSLDALVARRHLGGVILLGGWDGGTERVRATTRHLAALASKEDTAGLGLLLAADQEGGAVQQLRGDGFSRMPSARVQDQGSASALTADATRWADQLRRAGINVNLAPVADTVPTSIGRANGPIGQYDRQFSSDPERNARMVGAFIAGMRAGGVASTVKHFPGLGRITGNTDVTARGITDRTTTVDDPYLEPFRTGIQDGVELVMVGSAIYSRIDPGTNAVFSRPIVTDLLRDRLSYDGVVITDDVGAAKAVADVPVGARATRFIEAGGDITLTARPATVPTMHDAITKKMNASPAFAEQVRAAATRVVDLKLRMGLARCP
ncbi:glycoside hydrolase family 3 N-terminal domain-containing protein [Terracoccus sp. 273MFTsu3.1]|uniref:glycoside hydrolase family 3 N-terminal domain-containing protein n=1 Tax=Terracoccus sp. 273MFTsu3.1 TaxID=1172188 RepID=UPI000379DE60|nr:glycoside hydrolase family 3 N-terminal domain-containing protein [Terracoccus sp. 273MFTsu3.1]